MLGQLSQDPHACVSIIHLQHTSKQLSSVYKLGYISYFRCFVLPSLPLVFTAALWWRRFTVLVLLFLLLLSCFCLCFWSRLLCRLLLFIFILRSRSASHLNCFTPENNSNCQTQKWHSLGYQRPGQTAILPTPKVVRCLIPLIIIIIIIVIILRFLKRRTQSYRGAKGGVNQVKQLLTRSSAIAVIADRTACRILTLFIVIATSQPLNKNAVRVLL